MNKVISRTAAILTGLLLCTTAQATLISNGSFESPDVPTGGPGDGGANAAIPDWTLNAGLDDIRVFDGDFFGSGIVGQDGSQYLGFGTYGAPVGGTISQSFATSIGVTYQVSFWANNGFGESDGTVQQVVGSVDTTTPTSLTAAPSPQNQWQSFGFSFVATGSTTTLSFMGALGSGAGANSDILLDNVSVAPVPEPATSGLLALAMLGVLRMRRRAGA